MARICTRLGCLIVATLSEVTSDIARGGHVRSHVRSRVRGGRLPDCGRAMPQSQDAHSLGQPQGLLRVHGRSRLCTEPLPQPVKDHGGGRFIAPLSRAGDGAASSLRSARLMTPIAVCSGGAELWPPAASTLSSKLK